MAFPDPQSITVNAVAQSMPRILTNGQSAKYRKTDGTFELLISHLPTKNDRVRSTARFSKIAIVADPITAINDSETLVLQFVVDRPVSGFTQTDLEQMSTGFKTWLDNTAIGRLFGLES